MQKSYSGFHISGNLAKYSLYHIGHIEPKYLHDTLWFLCFVGNSQITAVNKRFISRIGFNFFVLINYES